LHPPFVGTADAKDSLGELKYPRFEQLRQRMAELVQEANNGGRPMTLQEAYRRAGGTPAAKKGAASLRDDLRDALLRARAA
jgi:hypothetical protein